MTTPRRVLVAFALAAALAAACAAIALGQGTAGPPKRASVTSKGLRTGSVLGSYCSVAAGVGGCGDAKYPLHPRTFLPITPGSSVRVNLRKRTKVVEARLVRVLDAGYTFVGKELAAKPVAGSDRRVWQLRLPDDLQAANALSIFAKFKDGGDADFWAGVRPVAQWPYRSTPYEGDGPWGPPRARVTSHGLTTGTAIGEWCSKRHKVGNEYAVACVQKRYPLDPRTSIPITPGGVVFVDARDRAERGVTARLKHVEGNSVSDVGPALEVTPVDSRKRVWRIQLPQDLDGATDLSIWADFAQPSYANYWAGVTPVTRWP